MVGVEVYIKLCRAQDLPDCNVISHTDWWKCNIEFRFSDSAEWGGLRVTFETGEAGVRQCTSTLGESAVKYLDLKYLLRWDFCLFTITFSLWSLCMLLFIKAWVLAVPEDTSLPVTSCESEVFLSTGSAEFRPNDWNCFWGHCRVPQIYLHKFLSLVSTNWFWLFLHHAFKICWAESNVISN